MSTSTFGTPAGAPEAPEPPAEARGGKRTALIAAGAGVAALLVLGGAAALVLSDGGGDELDPVVPPAAVGTVAPAPETPPATTAATPLPTSVIRGRNVFVPLVEDASQGDAGAGAGSATGGAGGSGDGGSAGGYDTASPTALPTSSPTGAPGDTAPLVVTVPGPTTTVTVTGPPQQVPGPTTTVEVPGRTVRVPVPGPTVTVPVPAPDFEELLVSVAEVDGEYWATFVVDGVTLDPVAPSGTTFFGPGDRFRYLGYDPDTRRLVFGYVSALFTITVPLADAPPAD